MDSPGSWRDGVRGDLFSPVSPSGAFYAVHLPAEDGNEGRSFVSDSKEEALRAARKNRRARFKAFSTLSDAEAFAEQGPPLIYASSPPPAAEKSSPFKAPKASDLINLRRAVVHGNVDEVGTLVTANPRLLVGSGDTPAIIQEGFRCNCLHIAAKFGRAEIAELILERIADPAFLALLYGDYDDLDALTRRAHVLVDLYLNTPDKIINDTPLHLAVKSGSVKTVRVLISYTQCDWSVRNKKGLTAAELVEHVDIPTAEKDELSRLLSGGVFVAVLRSPDLAEEPLVKELPAASAPPSAGGREVAALVGPMEEELATVVRRLWRRPLLSPARSPLQGSPTLVPERRLEAIGRALSADFQLPWAEYWPFLGGFADLRSKSGLQKLENYLSDRHRSINSTVDALCQTLGNLRFSPADDALCHACIEITARTYAGKLARALTTPSTHSAFVALLNRIHSLIRSCAEDIRYAGVEFERMHSRLASLTRDEVSFDLDTARKFLTDFQDAEPSYRCGSGPNGCLVQHLIAAFRNEVGGDPPGIEAKQLWRQANTCLCNFAEGNSRNNCNKKLNFDHTNPWDGIIQTDRYSWNLSGYSTDSSDDSYYTPATSPHLSRSSSTEDMLSADESSSVFIFGFEPSRMDAAVFDAIDPNAVSPDEFPAIFEWIVAFQGFLNHGGQLPPPPGYATPPVKMRTTPVRNCLTPQTEIPSPLDSRSIFSA